MSGPGASDGSVDRAQVLVEVLLDAEGASIKNDSALGFRSASRRRTSRKSLTRKGVSYSTNKAGIKDQRYREERSEPRCFGHAEGQRYTLTPEGESYR